MAVKSSLKNMLLCLGVITLVCAVLLAVVYTITVKPIIEAKNEKERAALAAVSPDFSSMDKGVAEDGSEYYITKDGGEAICYVVKASSTGFGGTLEIMAGFLPDGKIYRTTVLSQNETPGLGAKCCEDSFIRQFDGFDAVDGKLSVKQDGGDIDAITAATITSRAFCVALGNAYKLFETLCPKVAAVDTSEVAADSAALDITNAVQDSVKVEKQEEVIQ